MMEVVGEFEYNKKDLIGHGAFAVVFKGRNRKRPDVTVAVKSITKKNLAKSQNLLSKEIKILKELSDLHHENVVALLDCKETTNHVYLVMEYCNGGDLADYLQAKGTLSEDTISVFLKQIAAAMKALNAKGIVHRDLKPQNILLCKGEKTTTAVSEIRLKIADFGFARFLNDGVMAATLCGSPMYMAPEVIMSLQYDAKADLWSIGTIVFQCLTGKAPFQAQTPQQLKHFYEKHGELAPNIPQGTSSELRDLLMKLLKRNAKDRIKFEDFFMHPFLKAPSPAASSPVPVPSRSHSFSAESPTPLKPVSSSPLSGGHVQYSPPTVKESERDIIPVPINESPSGSEVYMKMAKGETEGRCHSSAEQEDFVMVPEGLQYERSDGGSKAANLPLSPYDNLDGYSEDSPPSLAGVRACPSDGTVTFRKDSQTSPSRPSTLQVTTPTTSPTSQPIPVPSKTQAMSNSPSSPMNIGKSVETNSPLEAVQERAGKGVSIPHQNSEARLSGPDLSSLSPPAVQFTIGTPPSATGQWKRGSMGNLSPGRHGGTPPNVCGSPLKRSGTTPPCFSPLPGSLPTIMGSPSRLYPTGLEYSPPRHPSSRHQHPVNAPFGSCRPSTVPENMAAITYDHPEYYSPPPRKNLFDCGRCSTEPDLLEKREGSSLLSNQLLRAAFGSQQPPGGAAVAAFGGWGGSRERLSSQGSDKTGSMERERSSSYFRRGSGIMETSPPASLVYAQSPPNMEGPITFVAPELAEETLMDDHHNEVMAKLSFVLDLVECILELAQARGTPLGSFSESVNLRQGEGLQTEQIPKLTEAQRRLEQMVLYVRSLHLLSSALQLARTEINAERLQISNTLKGVVQQMNRLYHKCILACKQIQLRMGAAFHAALTPQIVVATADKLIYNFAIEMCQTAALDELFGNPQECFRRYQTAQILLHSLAQQTRSGKDRELLNKYKSAVERRLSHLQSQVLLHNLEAVS